MMYKRQRHWRTEDLDVWDEFWDGLWSAISSELGHRTAAAWTRPGEQPAPPTMAPPPPPPAVVISTVSVTTTILSTTFVTVAYSESPGTAETSISRTTSAPTSSDSASISRTSTLSTTIPTTNLDSILPPLVTASSQMQLPPIATNTPIPAPSANSASNATADSMIGADEQSQSQKKAVVGGLSGAIAGFIFVGVLICLILRIRRKKKQPKEIVDAASEKGERPLFFRTWTGLSIAGVRDRPRTAQQRPGSISSVTVDEDHRIIRMNTRHWPRPFAPGAGEGYRDSAPHGQLRVMNPDLSRPMTPRRSSETASSFLKKQRSALTGFVFGAPRSSHQQHPLAQSNIPTITVVDPTLSRECIAPYARTPSFKSYPSINTLPIVRQEPPEDPFITPQVESNNQLGHHHQTPPRDPSPGSGSRLRRPSLSTLHSTFSHLLHPFRSNNPNTNTIQNVRNASHFSTSTSNSASNSSYRRSDPFDLSVRGSHYNHHHSVSPRMGSEFQRRGSANPNWIMYEGT